MSSWWIHFASDTCPETSACALAVQSCSSRKPLPMPKLFEKPSLYCLAAAEPDGAAAEPAADGAAAEGAAADGAAALGGEQAAVLVEPDRSQRDVVLGGQFGDRPGLSGHPAIVHAA